jgi:hypothetical protein
MSLFCFLPKILLPALHCKNCGFFNLCQCFFRDNRFIFQRNIFFGNIFIFNLKQQPGIFSSAVRFYQCIFTFQVFCHAIQHATCRQEFLLAMLHPVLFYPFLLHQQFIKTFIPNYNRSGTVTTWYDAFKVSVIIGMVFHHHGKAFNIRVSRRTFRHCPAFQHTFHFQSEIIMQIPCIMFLNYKAKFINLEGCYSCLTTKNLRKWK